MKGRIEIRLCNNNSSGNLIDYVSCIEFSEDNVLTPIVRFEHIDLMNGEKHDLNESSLEIHGMKINHSGINYHVGNIMWNTIYVPIEEALRLLNLIAYSREWIFDTAYTQVWDKAQRGEEIEGSDIDERYNGIKQNNNESTTSKSDN